MEVIICYLQFIVALYLKFINFIPPYTMFQGTLLSSCLSVCLYVCRQVVSLSLSYNNDTTHIKCSFPERNAY